MPLRAESEGQPAKRTDLAVQTIRRRTMGAQRTSTGHDTEIVASGRAESYHSSVPVAATPGAAGSALDEVKGRITARPGLEVDHCIRETCVLPVTLVRVRAVVRCVCVFR